MTGPSKSEESSGNRIIPAAVASVLVVCGLLPLQLRLEPPGLMAERLLPGAGWLMIGLLSLYAGWLTIKMLDRKRQAVWRRRIWLLFSVVFYGQLILGLAGFEQFLMTGKLHFPIPALIAAGPAYRGSGWFMPVLLGASLLLIGPAWCSHLCYQGAWDHTFSRRRKPGPLPPWTRWLRLLSPVVVVGAALALRLMGVSWIWAGILSLGFGILAVGVMIFFSARLGTMVHCTVFCPIGALASLLGKLSLLRMRIGPDCDGCGSCTQVCRYDAVKPSDLEKGRVALTCTLCGDCVGSCRKGQMRYWFPGLGPESARKVFIVMAVSLHSMFLGVAMI